MRAFLRRLSPGKSEQPRRFAPQPAAAPLAACAFGPRRAKGGARRIESGAQKRSRPNLGEAANRQCPGGAAKLCAPLRAGFRSENLNNRAVSPFPGRAAACACAFGPRRAKGGSSSNQIGREKPPKTKFGRCVQPSMPGRRGEVMRAFARRLSPGKSEQLRILFPSNAGATGPGRIRGRKGAVGRNLGDAANRGGRAGLRRCARPCAQACARKN